MQYIEIKDNLKGFVAISAKDILKVDPDFHNQRLSEWQKKGYIKKIIKGYYIFSDLEVNESVLFIIANRIFEPSYISLEMALSYHGLIPESVYSITSVTSRKTYKFVSTLGQFSYHKIKPELMFGYQLVNYQNQTFKMAEIEKAILDYFYINSKLKTAGEFEELRINKDTFRDKVNMENFRKYLAQFNNKALEKRVNSFIKYLDA
jgi:predicted transcriptional regulator of viral defense system